MTLILASASPRRAELLNQMGVVFQTKAVDIDETPFAGEQVVDYVERLAIAKAEEAKKYFLNERVIILGSDTSVTINNEILGKPTDKEDALRMLALLSGKTHRVLTAVAILEETTSCIVSENLVTFSTISEQEREWYWSTGEPIGKAGAYAIQGKAAMFIRRLEGSFSGVMGLPLFETTQLLKKHGISIQ